MAASPNTHPFRHRAFLLLWIGRFLTTIGNMTQSVAVGWEVYSIARETRSIEQSSFLVGMVGLAQFLPMFALALLAGETADRYDRRKILVGCAFLQIISAVAFTYLASQAHPTLTAIFIVASFFGIARAFSMPATTSLAPMLVPAEILPNAIALNTLATQGGQVLGPWVGGVLCATSPSLANATAGGMYLIALLSGLILLAMPLNTKPQHSGASRAQMIKEGLAYLWTSKIVLGAISLDLFAVLLGGVTALLPVYARDILLIGPSGFGLLRSGAAIGGGVVTILLSIRPFRRHAGYWMLGAVSVYGVATILFAISRDIALSMVMLMILGAADSISVFVRQSLVQIVTPNNMRGRISAVSSLFISASNELGEFESGTIASWLGPEGSALFGGIGSIAVTLIWAGLFPALRKTDRLAPPEL